MLPARPVICVMVWLCNVLQTSVEKNEREASTEKMTPGDGVVVSKNEEAALSHGCYSKLHEN